MTLLDVQSAPRKPVHHHEIFTPDHPCHQTSTSWHHGIVNPHVPNLCPVHTYQTQKLCESLHWLIKGTPLEKLLLKWAVVDPPSSESSAPTTTKPSRSAP